MIDSRKTLVLGSNGFLGKNLKTSYFWSLTTILKI